MAKEQPGKLEVQSCADHHVITQPNPLRKVLLRVPESDLDDPVGRAEKALAGLSGEFRNWMTIEADRLSAAHAAILRDCFTDDNRETHGKKLWNWPIIPPTAARETGATDLIISSWLHQDAIHARRATYEQQGLTVHRIYPTP